MRTLLAFIMIVFASSALDSEENRTINVPTPRPFEFDGKPIPPSAIDTLNGCIAENGRRVAALDLAGFVYNQRPKVTFRDEWVEEHYEEGGLVAYRWLGMTDSGTHVVLFLMSGGGSGVFEDLVFVRKENDVVQDQGKSRVRQTLRCVGSFCLGDRDDGRVTMVGNRIFISASRYRREAIVLTVE